MEGHLHKIFKQSVADELQAQNFSIHYEPLESPLENLWWHSYRPDILATWSCNSNLQVVIVECETKPNRKRVLTKTSQIQQGLSFQKRLYQSYDSSFTNYPHLT